MEPLPVHNEKLKADIGEIEELREKVHGRHIEGGVGKIAETQQSERLIDNN